MKASRTESLFPAVRRLLRQEALHEEPSDWGGTWAEAWEELNRVEDAILNWSECYPEDVFVPPTQDDIRAVVRLLREHGYTSDALYAHWGRHIVRCLREVMGQPEDPPPATPRSDFGI